MHCFFLTHLYIYFFRGRLDFRLFQPVYLGLVVLTLHIARWQNNNATNKSKALHLVGRPHEIYHHQAMLKVGFRIRLRPSPRSAFALLRAGDPFWRVDAVLLQYCCYFASPGADCCRLASPEPALVCSTPPPLPRPSPPAPRPPAPLPSSPSLLCPPSSASLPSPSPPLPPEQIRYQHETGLVHQGPFSISLYWA